MPYRDSGSTLTAVGRSQLLARWPGTHSRTSSGIQRATQTVLGVYLKRTCSRVTGAPSALGVLNDYALYKSTHSLTHSPEQQVVATVLVATGRTATALCEYRPWAGLSMRKHVRGGDSGPHLSSHTRLLDPHSLMSHRHLDRFIRFCSAHASDQKTRRRATQRHVCNNRPHLMLGVRCGLITRPVEHQCIRQASTGQATQQAMGSRMADYLHLRRKFGWNMKGLVFDFTLYMIHSIAVYVLICWKSLCYSI